jgi:hypothetical protein
MLRNSRERYSKDAFYRLSLGTLWTKCVNKICLELMGVQTITSQENGTDLENGGGGL